MTRVIHSLWPWSPDAPGGPPSPSWTLDFTGTPSGYTLTRASTGTFVDSSGYIASASTNVARLTHNSSGSRLGLLVEAQRTNLVLRSEDLTTTWTNTNTTETGNAATAPDNNLTADELIESSGTTVNRYISSNNISFTSGVTYTASVYAKANSATCMQIFFGGGAFGTGAWATFNVSAGTVGSVGATVTTADRSITDVGNGWYRCTLTQTATATSNQTLSLCLTNNTATTTRAPAYTVTAGNERGLYLWGAQFEVGATVSSYIPSTTASVTRSADIASVATSNITGFANNSTLLVEYYRPATDGMVTATNEAVSSMGKTGYIGVRSTATATQSDLAWDTSFTQSGANGNLTGTVNATLQKFAYTINSGGTILKSCMNGSMLTTTKTGADPDMTLSDTLFLGQEEGGISYSNVIIRKVAFYNSVLSDADMQTITT